MCTPPKRATGMSLLFDCGYGPSFESREADKNYDLPAKGDTDTHAFVYDFRGLTN